VTAPPQNDGRTNGLTGSTGLQDDRFDGKPEAWNRCRFANGSGYIQQ
jgi:hypothetical protein